MKTPSSLIEYYSILCTLHLFDTVFVQKKRFHAPFLQLVRTRAKRIVYDFDDAVMYKDSFSSSTYSRTRQRQFANMVRQSDHVIAGNSFLMDQALKYNENVTLIPTSLDVRSIEVKKFRTNQDKVTIGWIGSRSTIRYLQMFRDVWEEIGKKYSSSVELKIICDTFFECNHIQVRKVLWSKDNEDTELKSIDIGVMPLTDDPWSKGKCGFKILQYFGSGIPAVCSPVGINRDIVEHGINGFLPSSREEWILYISRLIENPTLRQKMGLAGRDTLEKNYTVDVNAQKIFSIVHGV